MADYRLVRSDEEDAFYKLTLYAFNRPDSKKRQAFFHELFKNSDAYGAFGSDGTLESGFLSIPFTAQMQDDRFKTSGISYVSSFPESSGQGHIFHLMKKFLADAKQAGTTLSYLAPFSFSFYRRFGYEEVFDRTAYRINNIDLPKVVLPDFVKQADVTIKRMPFAEAASLIAEFHNMHPYSQNGGVIREPWWNDYLILKHPWDVALSYVDGKLDGYLIFTRHENTSFEINELFYNSRTSMWKLLQFVTAHKTAYDFIDYVSGNPEPRIDLFPNPHEKTSLTVETQAYMMARIIDLPKFLENYHVDSAINDRFVIAVTDEFLPENSQHFQIEIQSGHIQATVVENVPSIATLTIQRLTQILFNYRSPETFFDLELTPEAVAHLRNLQKPAMKPMLWDYF